MALINGWSEIFNICGVMFDNKKIDAVRKILIERKQAVAVAESVTSGYLQAAFASAELAMQFFEGGITAYNIDQKVRHLGIDRKKGEESNCVSPETAAEMALGAASMFKTDWGISVTGYATPVPESGFLLYAFFAICFKGKILFAEKIESGEENPINAQLFYVNSILDKFAAIVDGKQSVQ
jgi:nicotinamide-nucleotide amidase